MIRVLVYAFGPYRRFRDNVTEEVLARLPRRAWLKRTVFGVSFHRARFVRVVEKFNPALIIGLGQCSRGRRLRIESRAINRRRERPGARPRPIARRGPRTLPVTLKLELDGRCRRSSYAGDYVCNYSMYVLLDFLRRRRLAVRFGFVHIPWRYDPEEAARVLAVALGRLARGEAGSSCAGRALSSLQGQAKKQRR